MCRQSKTGRGGLARAAVSQNPLPLAGDGFRSRPPPYNAESACYLRVVDATALPATRSRSLHRFANPGRFLRLASAVQPWVSWPGLILTVIGLTWGLFFSPADWQQGDSVRIMYIHVPAAWLASAGYLALALC